MRSEVQDAQKTLQAPGQRHMTRWRDNLRRTMMWKARLHSHLNTPLAVR